MDSCPCCVDDTHKRQLSAAPLRELTEEQLNTYTWKAMTTWGEVDDFKHFLPRILELMASSQYPDTSTLNKLEYGNWSNWNEIERDAIRQFMLAWWADICMHTDEFSESLFIETLNRTGSIETMLNLWKPEAKGNSIKQLVDFVYLSFTGLINSNSPKSPLSPEQSSYLKKWANNQATILTNAFFNYEKEDPEFAQKISDALYILEKVTPLSNKV